MKTDKNQRNKKNLKKEKKKEKSEKIAKNWGKKYRIFVNSEIGKKETDKKKEKWRKEKGKKVFKNPEKITGFLSLAEIFIFLVTGFWSCWSAAAAEFWISSNLRFSPILRGEDFLLRINLLSEEGSNSKLSPFWSMGSSEVKSMLFSIICTCMACWLRFVSLIWINPLCKHCRAAACLACFLDLKKIFNFLK